MKKHLSRVAAAVLAIGALTATASVIAQQAPKPEQLIKWRQSVYQVIGWNCGLVKTNLDGQYDKEAVKKAANTIAAIANSGLGALYAHGTETGKGWKETAAKPEIFTDPKVGEIAASFGKEASELARLADTGDVGALKVQFGKLTATCKACHDDFRQKG